MAVAIPNVFFSYSHDTDDHKNWALNLATRLVANGVNVVLDQWDLTFGSDLPRFIELGLTGAHRVLAICTETYVNKSNGGTGGVGYEKMILTAQLMQNVTADRIIPVVRNNLRQPLLPTFLGDRFFVDFRNDANYEAKYAELVRDIYGERIKPRPPLGQNPFSSSPPAIIPVLSFSKERYVSPALTGSVVFDLSNNNGRYIIGAGDMAFETSWSTGGHSTVHAYNDPHSIRTVAIAVGARAISDIRSASTYDTSSRSRSPMLGEIVIWQNTTGYYAATQVHSLKVRGDGQQSDEIQFAYAIAPNKSESFIP